MPVLEIVPNQLVSIFDSVVNIENKRPATQKCDTTSTVCLYLIPDGNPGDTVPKIKEKKGSFTIWETLDCSNSYFVMEDIKYLFTGVVLYKDYVFFIHKYFSASRWFKESSNILKLKRKYPKKDDMPTPENLISWEVRYDKDKFYFRGNW